MKYIRTKDGIYKVEEVEYNECIGMNQYFYKGGHINSHEIVKEADTIEELCDEFVIYQKGFLTPETSKVSLEEIDNWYGQNNEYRERVIYGAIWTDKGLTYVAKMNSRGEFEILL